MLRDASKRKRGVPIALIAHTVKGKGVSFAENNIEWHDGTLDDALYQRALHELDGGR
jgi:transketolase